LLGTEDISFSGFTAGCACTTGHISRSLHMKKAYVSSVARCVNVWHAWLERVIFTLKHQWACDSTYACSLWQLFEIGVPGKHNLPLF